MAGGAKETPRQKMIGMMYLVLTALLALQVSNSVLDKFIFIDQSLKHSYKITMDSNEKVIEGINDKVEKNGNKDRDKDVLEKTLSIREATNTVNTRLDEIYKKIIEKSGGLTEDGKLAGAKDYDKQMNYTIGPVGSKSGVAYTLQDELNSYVDQLNATVESLTADLPDSLKASLDFTPIHKFALDASEINEFKDDPDQKTKDFAQLNFENTPTVACLAIISQMRSEVAQAESKALEELAKSIGADQLKFDKIVPVVKPYSSVVAAGTKYSAEMFIAASSSTATPKMTYNGNTIKVEEGKGFIEFVATPGTYDKSGNATKTWKGSITIPTPFGDTTFVIEEEYVVAKPVISIQAAAVSALYFNCGNELNVQVPALGVDYEPSFAANGGDVIPGSEKGKVTIVPNKGKVALTVKSKGNTIGTKTFRVKTVPKPDIVPFVNNKPADLKNGVNAASGPRGLELRAIADKDFKEFLPNDARYRVTGWVVTLARGKRSIGSKKVTSGKVNLSDLAQKAKAGDRYVIETKQVMRMNFRNKTEEVRGVTGNIFTIPIN